MAAVVHGENGVTSNGGMGHLAVLSLSGKLYREKKADPIGTFRKLAQLTEDLYF